MNNDTDMTSNIADSFGSPTSSPQSAINGINDFCEGFVSYQPRAVNVLKTADDHEESALANIYAGMLWMFLERPEAPSKALPYLERANRVTGVNRREIGLLEILKAWQRYDFVKLLKVGEVLCHEFPEDLSLLKIMQYHSFNAGNSELMLKLALGGESANAHLAPVHSMVAFGHEQMNNIDLAQRAAQKALEIDANEPWGHHALAHIHLSRGTTIEGLSLLVGSSPSWAGLNSFMFTHNWWHVALFEIANGDVNKALSIYDERCWGVEPEYSQDQIGAVSLLARLELANVDVGDRWQALRPYLESRGGDVIQPFLTLQYLYGLAKSGSAVVDTLMTLIERQADQSEVPSDKTLWTTIGIPAAKGLVAHARDNYETAVGELASVRSSLWQVGGSHAQRDLFEQVLLDARLRAGHWEAARRTLEQRKQWEPESPLLYQRLNDVYRHLNAGS